MAPSRTLVAVLTVVAVAALGGPTATAEPVDRCPELEPTLVGTEGDDELVGTAGDDVIVGLGGDDVLRGEGGSDVICGGPGTDRLVGDEGDDALYGGANGLQQPFPDNPPDNVGDTLVPGPGDDHLDPGYDVETDADGGFVPDTVTFAGAAAGVTVDLAVGTASGEGADTLAVDGRVTVIGTPHDDRLLGTPGPEELVGGRGDDLLRGLAGDDRLRADPDGHRLTRAGGDDRAYGGPGRDSLRLGNGDDIGRAGAGPDLLVHGAGDVELVAGPGRDYLESHLTFAPGQRVRGGRGTDELYLWAVVDSCGRPVRADGRIDLPAGRITVRRGDQVRRSVLAGVERLRVPNGVWRVRGTAADERFYGAETAWSRLLVRAGAGDDLVGGTPGDDRIHGGPGIDRSGDTQGRDVCVSVERWFGGDRCEVVR